MTDDTPEGVLTPDELELPDDHVTELDEGRYLVRSDGDARDDGASEAPPVDAANDRDPPTAGDRNVEPADLRLDCEEAYAIAAQVKTDRGTGQRTVRSNDVSEVFEEFVRWYAGRVAPDRSPEEVLAVLVQSSDLAVRTTVD